MNNCLALFFALSAHNILIDCFSQKIGMDKTQHSFSGLHYAQNILMGMLIPYNTSKGVCLQHAGILHNTKGVLYFCRLCECLQLHK